MTRRARRLLLLCCFSVAGILAGLVLGASLEQLLIPVVLELVLLFLPERREKL